MNAPHTTLTPTTMKPGDRVRLGTDLPYLTVKTTHNCGIRGHLITFTDSTIVTSAPDLPYGADPNATRTTSTTPAHLSPPTGTIKGQTPPF